MFRMFERLWKDRRGNVLAIAAAALPLVVGSAGLATDTIQWVTWKRQLQRAADSGALAGVHTIVRDEGSRDNVSLAVERDLTHNNHVGITTTRLVRQPQSGPYASSPYAVEVVLTVQKRLGFSSLFLSDPPTITATATATVVATGRYCVISLEETTQTGLEYAGNATVDLGCGMATNSIGSLAVDAGGSSYIHASPIAAVGGISESGNFSAGMTLQPYSMRQLDPFAHIGVMILRKLLRNERGSSAIEMALAAPFLAALLIGMVDLSRGYSAKLQLEQAAQRTIEKVVQQRSVVTDYTEHKLEAAEAAGVTVDAVTVNSWLECSSDGQNWREVPFDGTCETGETYYARYVEVDIVKTYNPLFSTKFAGANADGTYTLRGIAGVRIQ